MNNRICLKDWLETPHLNIDYQDLFYGLHRELRILLESHNSYVPDLNLRNSLNLAKVLENIQLTWTNIRFATYLNKRQVDLLHRQEVKRQNIEFLIALSASLYMGYDLKNGLFNYQILEENFDQCKFFYPEEDQEYYEDVIVHKNYQYYDEYVEKKKNSSQRGYQMVKGGTGFSSVSDEEYYPNKSNAAFVQMAFLYVAFFGVAIFTVMFVLFILY